MSWSFELRARAGEFQLDVQLEGDARTLALMGPNGAGKTTLLRLLAGATRPDAGRFAVEGRTLIDAAADLCLPPEARRIGYVPQGYRLFPHLDVLANVAFGLSLGHRRLPRGARNERAAALLDELGCAGLAERLPSELSGGERQRVALARALVVGPELLLLDEPLSAIDWSARKDLRRFLAEHLARRPHPTFVATHDLRDALALDADIVVLEAGRVAQRGSAAALAAAPATAFIAELCEPLTLASTGSAD